ncbi:RNA 2',3'-cyclic phosphodiesterase [Streptomyces sp. URMC 129]|uniref:RNA 2',3'-cyclic phosphodiesterase n=1 Tax=Streptomyces sp. URMC 129 TaxID=3423407 RepID=UPI003F193F16
MRLFAAVVPPAPALAELAAAVRALHGLPGADLLRWTDPAGWHLALAFYGEVPDAALPALRARLARGAARHPAPELRLAGGGRFADRVLWAGVTGGTDVLRRLAGTASAAARRAGVPMPESRPYHPHVTLARGGRTRVGLGPFAAALGEFAGGAWTASAFHLVRSHLPVAGEAGERPRYETVDSWALAGGGDDGDGTAPGGCSASQR